MHRAARRMRQRLGHAHHGQPMFQGDLLQQVLEQEGLVGQQHRIAMQEIDLELADSHLVHEGVTRHPQQRHAAVDLLEEGTQAAVGAHAERRTTVLAATIQPNRWLERLVGIGIGREHEELQLGGHHRRPAALGIAIQYTAQQATGGQARRAAIQLLGIADRQGTRAVTPRQAMDLSGVGHQGQVTIVTAVEACRRIAAHDALQQHATRQLQTPPGEEALAGHHLAPHHAIQVRRHALDLIDSSQALCQLGRDSRVHVVFLVDMDRCE